MAETEKRSRQPIRETTKRGEKRLNSRFPKSSIWSEEQRRLHREERDSVLEEVGLVTDRMLGPEGEPIAPDGDSDPGKGSAG